MSLLAEKIVLPAGIGPSDLVSFTFKDKDYTAIINIIESNILHVTLMPTGQQLKLYYSNGVWLAENRVPITNVNTSKNPQRSTIIIEEKTDFTRSQLSDLKVLVLLKNPEFNALCRTNKHLGQLCRNPILQNEIYKERILIHMPEAMKYVTNSNYKEVYQSVTDLEKTQLFKDIVAESWSSASPEEFSGISNIETIEKIFNDDDIIALRYLIDMDNDDAILQMFSIFLADIARLLAENGAIKILNWLIRSGQLKTYYANEFSADFSNVEEYLVYQGLERGTIVYLKNLADLGLYDPNPEI